MSNINGPRGRHGVDDEFNTARPSRCPVCWGKARRRFFDPERAPRRGVTLQTVYTDIHSQEHEE